MGDLARLYRRLKLAWRVLVHGPESENHVRALRPLTTEEVEEAQSFFPLRKFFVFGHARSGTTLLARLIRVHPQVHCNWQAHFFTRPPTLEGLVNRDEIGEWFSRRSNRWNRGQDLSPVAVRAIADFILEREARRLGKTVVGDKSPNSLLHGEAVRLLHKIYPDGKLIFIVRDGRDAAISHRFQIFIDASQHLTKEDRAIRTAFERDPEPFLCGERSIFTEKAICRAARDWARNVIETDQLGRALFGDQYIALRYEDLLESPMEQMTRLWEFLSVDTILSELPHLLEDELTQNPDRDWQRHKAEKLISPLSKGKSGSWRELFTRRDKTVFYEIASAALAAWGYDKSDEVTK